MPLMLLRRTNKWLTTESCFEYDPGTLEKDASGVETVQLHSLLLKYDSEALRRTKEWCWKRCDYMDVPFNMLLKSSWSTSKWFWKRSANMDVPFNMLLICSRRTKQVVLEMVRQHGCALQYAADLLKEDKQVVLEAV